MEELAHNLLATDNRSCGSLGPTTWHSSSTASRHVTAVSDTLISSLLDTVVFSVPRVALVLWHDQQYVWFVPKVAPSKHWVANFFVEVGCP